MAEISMEILERIRHSGSVIGIERFREQLMMNYRKEKYIIISIEELSKLVERLEENE